MPYKNPQDHRDCQRRLRAAASSKGLCVNCLKSPAVPDRARCESCLVFFRALDRRRSARQRTEKYRKYINAYIRNRKQTDIAFRLISSLRARLGTAIKGGYKSGSAMRDLGCSVQELKVYLEAKFYPHSETGEAMNWGNYGLHGWHIDHIIPLSSFDLTDPEHLRQGVHYTNLQPLWAKDNLSKGSKR